MPSKTPIRPTRMKLSCTSRTLQNSSADRDITRELPVLLRLTPLPRADLEFAIITMQWKSEE